MSTSPDYRSDYEIDNNIVLSEEEIEIRKAKVAARILEREERGCEHLFYWYCKKCIDEGLPQRISVGPTLKGIQVWCETHNENVHHEMIDRGIFGEAA